MCIYSFHSCQNKAQAVKIMKRFKMCNLDVHENRDEEKCCPDQIEKKMRKYLLLLTEARWHTLKSKYKCVLLQTSDTFFISHHNRILYVF